MTRNSKSFILSLLVHFVLAVSIFYLYKILSASTQETHLCACCSTTINLNTIQTSKVVKTSENKNKEQTKVEKTEKQSIKEIAQEVPKQEAVVKKEIVVKEEVSKQVQQPDIQAVQENTEQLVEVDQNLTQSVQNTTQKKDVDTHCKTEVIATKEPQHKENNYLSLHVSEIVSLLKENLYYPRRARMQGIEGIVTVKFTLSTEAKISNIEVVESKHNILSRAAVETIENLEEKLPKPDEELTLTIPINYDLQ
ncbi:energy transducer TonB [Sulfurimonas sp. C5]|uniref:energy transducer TonB n=1 Tax=Sulfurimonas sp. C5 TaxID=3036947 RepID=UPI0024583F36|nr:energy transducer TonB [Sulfurimonas sp. C5]MDH4945379.1 energy transducer TonB [Sulfurimonas sp. C5]